MVKTYILLCYLTMVFVFIESVVKQITHYQSVSSLIRYLPITYMHIAFINKIIVFNSIMSINLYIRIFIFKYLILLLYLSRQ